MKKNIVIMTIIIILMGISAASANDTAIFPTVKIEEEKEVKKLWYERPELNGQRTSPDGDVGRLCLGPRAMVVIPSGWQAEWEEKFFFWTIKRHGGVNDIIPTGTCPVIIKRR